MEPHKNTETRQFHIHLLLSFLIDISYGIIIVAVPLYLTTLDYSALEFGLIIGVASIGALLVKIPLGILSDKVGKKPLIYLGFFNLFFSTFFFSAYPDLLPILRVAQGLSMALIWVPLTALFVETFRDTGKIASFSGAFMFGFLMGNLLGGILPQFEGFKFTFMLSAGLMLVCTFILSRINYPASAQARKSTGSTGNPCQLVRIWLLGISNSSALNIFFGFLPLFASRQLNYSPAQIGVLIFIEGITYVLLVVPIGRRADRIGKFRLSAFGTLNLLIVFLIFYISDTFLELAFASLMIGAISAATFPTNMAMASETMSDKGKAMGFFQTSHDMGALIGPALAGVISSAFGIRHAFLANIPIILFSFVLIIVLRRKSKSKLME